MSTPGYVIETAGAIALTATVAKTVLNIINGTNAIVRLVELHISFDGVTPTAVPIVVELCYCTQATAGTPTGGTFTPTQIRGATRTPQALGSRNYTAEPTAITVWKPWGVAAFNGSLTMQFPLGREPEQIVTADGLLLRCTAPATVNVLRAYLEFEEG
jgi:hypothetical protein